MSRPIAAHALSEGKESLKTLLDAAATLETPAYQKVLDERPGYREFQECLERFFALAERVGGGAVKEYRVDSVDRAGRGVHEHQCLDPLGHREHQPSRDHPTHGVAEKAKGLELARVRDAADDLLCVDLGGRRI